MSRGINKVILIGNVGTDPDIRYSANGQPVAKFSLATSEKYNDQEVTEWHKLVAFGKVAEIIEKYVKKGSKLYVEGKLKTNQWETVEGDKRYTTEIIVREMQFLDSKQDNGNKAPSQPPKQQTQQQPVTEDSDLPF